MAVRTPALLGGCSSVAVHTPALMGGCSSVAGCPPALLGGCSSAVPTRVGWAVVGAVVAATATMVRRRVWPATAAARVIAARVITARVVAIIASHD